MIRLVLEDVSFSQAECYNVLKELGVAILAGVGVGLFASLKDACDKLIVRNSSQSPNTTSHKEYAKNFKTCKRLYNDLKGCFNEQAENIAK